MPSIGIGSTIANTELWTPGDGTEYIYLRPGGVDNYFRPDGTSYYIRP